jgi:hypothetical protein
MSSGGERIGRWLVPGVPDLVFALVLASVLTGGHYRLLNDPGTTWHLRLGRDIGCTRDVPRFDTLSFTREHAPWVDQSWLFDLGLAWVVDRGGWSAAALASALGLAWLYSELARGLLRDGRTPLVALVVAVVATGVGAIHFLVRPHLFTLGFVFLLLRHCQRQHERGGWSIAWAPLITALWANLHGGFLAAPVVVATAAAGHAISGPLDRSRRREVLKFAAIVPLCLAAALLNPYGLGLFRHVAGLLVSSGVTELIEEYQPIPFGKPDARAVECVVLALVALPAIAAGRMSRYELAHALVWLHLSLASVRHAPLFGLAVAPGLARLLDGLFSARTLEAQVPARPEASERSVWPLATATVLGLAVACGATLGTFDPKHWPLSALPALDALPAETPMFHEQDWGGLISAECRPPRRVFIDDRFELYGKPAVLRYLNALAGGPDWDEIRDRKSIGIVWVRPDRALVRRLESDPAWRVRHRDVGSVLFERVGWAEPGREVAGRVGQGRNAD